MVQGPADLRKFAATIRRLDPAQGPASGQAFVLPVAGPDEEHAIASTLANAASFSNKAQGARALPVAFMAVRVARRWQDGRRPARDRRLPRQNLAASSRPQVRGVLKLA